MRELGLPDVSGLPYHEVVLTAMGFEEREPIAWRTRAWVLTPANEDGVAFVIWWDGLVYATRWIGAPANVDRDASSAIEGCLPTRSESERLGLDCFPASLGAMVLYGMGATELAKNAFDGASLTERRDLAPRAWSVAVGWASHRLRRALTSFTFGDDAVARAEVRWLAEAEAVLQSRAPQGSVYFNFLYPLDVLAGELARRAASTSEPPDAVTEDAPAPISVLIDALDDVRLRLQRDVVWRGAEVVQALAAHGGAAIEPLLAVLVDDDRLTRTLQGYPTLYPLPVRDAAFGALELIIEPAVMRTAAPTFDEGMNRDERRAFAARLRGSVERFGYAPAPETWFALLASDGIGVEAWAWAAARLTTHDGVTPSGANAPLWGEPLRARHDQAIETLLDVRLRSAQRTGDGVLACRLARASLAWSAPRVRPAVIEAARSCLRQDRFCDCSPELVIAIERAGSVSLLGSYRRWLESWPSVRDRDAVGPVIAFPDHPEMVAAARRFASRHNEYLPRVGAQTWFGRNALAFGLFELSPVRDRVLAELSNFDAYGIVWREEASVVLRQGPAYDEYPDPDARLLGDVRVVVRLRDIYAWMVSAIDGAPAFSLAWRSDRREAAIEEIRAFVQAYRPAAP
jgi:hypothetical protein